MGQDDGRNACLSGCLLAASFGLTPLAFVVAWAYTGDWRNGVLAGFIAFCLLLAGAFAFVTRIREPSVILTWAPFAAGVLYTLIPDFIPLAFDDAAATAAGAIATFALWLKRQSDVPKTAVLPLLFAAVYTLIGPMIPGPVDELFVDAIAVAASLALGRPRPKQLPPPAPPHEDTSL